MSELGGITALGGDQFLVNGKTIDLATLVRLIEFERADNLESQLADELEKMMLLNNKLEKARNMLSLARTELGAVGEGKSQMPTELADFFDENNIQQGLSEWDKNNRYHDQSSSGVRTGLNGYDFNHDKEQWQTSVDNLKSFIENLNTRSQLDMIDISSLLKKRDESLTLPSNTDKSFHEQRKATIRNIT